MLIDLPWDDTWSDDMGINLQEILLSLERDLKLASYFDNPENSLKAKFYFEQALIADAWLEEVTSWP